jgi:WXG100 family type VII secretion target
MANLNVTYQDLDSAAKKLNAEKEQIRGQLDSLQNYIANLVSSGFVTDSASVKFDQTYKEYTKGAKETIDALEGLAGYLTSAATTLRETDEQLGAALS